MFPHDADAGKALERVRRQRSATPSRRSAREAARLLRGRSTRRSRCASAWRRCTTRSSPTSRPRGRELSRRARRRSAPRRRHPRARAVPRRRRTARRRRRGARADLRRAPRLAGARARLSDPSRGGRRSRATRLVLVKRIARLYEEQLEDLRGRDSPGTRKVFREEPSDPATRDQLPRLAGVLDNWTRLAEVYEGYIDDEGPASRPTASRSCARSRRFITVASRTSIAPRRPTCACSSSTPTTRRRSSTSSSCSSRAKRWVGPPRRVSRRQRRDHRHPAQEGAALQAGRRCTRTSSRTPTPPSTPGARSLDLDGEDERAIAALDRLYTRGKRWHDLVELTLAPVGAGVKRAALVDRLETAIGAHLRGRALRPAGGDRHLRRGARPRQRASRGGARARAADRRPRSYVPHRADPRADLPRAGRLAEARRHLRRRARVHRRSSPSASSSCSEIARLHEKRGGDVRLAFAALARAWTDEAGEPDAAERETELFNELRRLAHMLGMWKGLVDVLAEGGRRFVRLRSAGARLCARRRDPGAAARRSRVGDRELAQGRSACATTPSRPTRRSSGCSPTRAATRSWCRSSRSAPGCRTISAEQKQLAYRAAELYEDALGEPEQAIATWRHVLTLDDTDAAALDALERLYFAQGRVARSVGRLDAEDRADAASRRRSGRCACSWRSSRSTSCTMRSPPSTPRRASWPTIRATSRRSRRWRACTRPRGCTPITSKRSTRSSRRRPIAAKKVELQFKAAGVLEREVGDAESGDRALSRGAVRAGRRRRAVARGSQGGPREAGARRRRPAIRRRRCSSRSTRRTTTSTRSSSSPSSSSRPRASRRRSGVSVAHRRAQRSGHRGSAGGLRRLGARARRRAGRHRGAEGAGAPRRALDASAGRAGARLRRAHGGRVRSRGAARAGAQARRHLRAEARRRGAAIAAYNKALDLPGPDGWRTGAADGARSLADAGGALARSRRRPREGGAGVDGAAGAGRVLLRSGALRAGELVDLDGALLAYRDALDREPAHTATRAGLEKLLARPRTPRPRSRCSSRSTRTTELGEGGALAEVRLGITSRASGAGGAARAHRRALREGSRRSARALDAMARAAATAPTRRGWPTRSSGWPRRRADPGAAAPRRLKPAVRQALGERRQRPATPSDSAAHRTALGASSARTTRAEPRYLYVLESDARERRRARGARSHLPRARRRTPSSAERPLRRRRAASTTSAPEEAALRRGGASSTSARSPT